jgi:hypothetical protein
MSQTSTTKPADKTYNRSKYNFWFLSSFSVLSVLLHFLPISRYYHNILFSANVFSLIGFTIIAFFFSRRLYLRYGETFRNIIQLSGLYRVINVNQYSLLTIAWFFHAIPVFVLMRYNYSLGNPIGWMLIYLVFAFQYLEKIYNMSLMELFFVALTTLSIFIGIYIDFREIRKGYDLFI